MIKMIVASDINGVIGVGNKLPWNIKAEMWYFKNETMGQNVLMGRRTWESIPEKYRPLIGRHNIVLTSDIDSVTGCHDAVASIDSAISKYEDLTVIGGESIYRQFLDRGLIDVIKLSVIDIEVPESVDNVMLPDIDLDKFSPFDSKQYDEFMVLTYDRKQS